MPKSSENGSGKHREKLSRQEANRTARRRERIRLGKIVRAKKRIADGQEDTPAIIAATIEELFEYVA